MLMPSIFGESLFDDWFDDFDKEFFGKKNPLYGKHSRNMMKTDVRETEGTYELDVDLPGFKKEDVTAELKDGYLTITAQKNHEDEQKNEEGKLLRRERYTGSCQRSFYVGEAVREDDCKASFADGILTVEVPKASAVEREERKMITIA